MNFFLLNILNIYFEEWATKQLTAAIDFHTNFFQYHQTEFSFSPQPTPNWCYHWLFALSNLIDIIFFLLFVWGSTGTNLYTLLSGRLRHDVICTLEPSSWYLILAPIFPKEQEHFPQQRHIHTPHKAYIWNFLHCESYHESFHRAQGNCWKLIRSWGGVM